MFDWPDFFFYRFRTFQLRFFVTIFLFHDFPVFSILIMYALWILAIDGLINFYYRFIVLWVVFKCQYFWSYSRKTNFWPFIHIFQRAVTQSKMVRLTWFFFYRFRRFQWSFFVLWVLSLSKNHEAKISKNWISWQPFWIFGGHLGLTMGNF